MVDNSPANNFEVGKTFGLLMKDGVIGEKCEPYILKTMAKKIANVSTRATSNLAFEIRDYALTEMKNLLSTNRITKIS